MAGGSAGRQGHLTGPLLLLLVALCGPVAAETLDIESQLYITAGLLGGLAFVLTIAVVYLLLTLNRIQSDVLKLQTTITEQEQTRAQAPTKPLEDNNEEKGSDTLQPPAPTQSQTVFQSQQQPMSQSQPMTQPQFQPMSQSQPMSQPQSQAQFMPQSQAASNPAFQPKMSNAQNPSYQQRSSVYQGPGYAQAPEPFTGGQPQQQAVPSYGFPQASQNPPQPKQSVAFVNGPYGGRPASQPVYFGGQAPAAPNPYVSSRPIYPRDRY